LIIFVFKGIIKVETVVKSY